MRVSGDDLRAEHVSQEVKGVGVCVRVVSVPRQGSIHAQINGRLTLQYVASIRDAIALLPRPQVSHAAQTDHGYGEAAHCFRPRV